MSSLSKLFTAILLISAADSAWSRGASPYLPLNMSPAIERKIERMLILAGKPIMRRPIAAATVLDAMPTACQADRLLCEEVRQYLRQYMEPWAVTSAKAELALTNGDSRVPIPNRHGTPIDSSWYASASGYAQLNDYVIVNAGGIAYDGDATATGSFISLGFDFAQLDIGYRDHWLSALRDSSSVISTEAPTMPSITLSNYRPLTPLGISYEIFAAEMSRQEGIKTDAGVGAGNPRLAGIQAVLEPVVGYAFGVSRVSQYGGASSSGVSDFFDELFQTGNLGSADEEQSNRVASLTSSILFPGPIPFAARVEYAGEDNAFSEGYRLGAINMTLGVDFPRLPHDLDATVEVSEWQNDWYVHNLYPRGLTHEGRVIGHWFGDERQFGDAIGGDSAMVAVGWSRRTDQYFRVALRTMRLDPRWRRTEASVEYERAYWIAVGLDTTYRAFPVDIEVMAGKDVFGNSFARLQASLDFGVHQAVRGLGAIAKGEPDQTRSFEWFADVGWNKSSTLKILSIGTPSDPASRTTGEHIGLGARRAVSPRNHIGVRLELDKVDDQRLLSVRAIDYQFRAFKKLALNGFAGFARYDYGLATDGYYWGAGIQFVDVFPKWDIGIDVRHYEKLNRDKVLPTDPVPSAATHPRLYIDIDGMAFYVSRRW